MLKSKRICRPPLLINRSRNLVATLLLLGSCSSAPPQRSYLETPQVPPSPTTLNQDLASMAAVNAVSPSADYQIGPEDRVQITLYSIPETEAGSIIPRTTEVVVSQQGKITLPMLGDIAVVGMTSAGLEAGLRDRYRKYFQDPQVGVQVKEYRSQGVSVIGSVQRPGVFPLSGPKTLIDMLALAGGVTETAGSQVHLYRHGPDGRQNYIVDLYALATSSGSLNVPIQKGDVINVPRAGMFFVDGAVRKPGSYALSQPYTFSQALAAAGGVDNSEANSSQITVFRRLGASETQTLSVNMHTILAGGAVDPPIQANDVIFVPTSTPKAVVKSLLNAVRMGFGFPLR